MIFDKRKMIRVLKLATPHEKRNKQLLLCEAPNQPMDKNMSARSLSTCVSPHTVCLFSNETKDDGINPKQIEIIKFRKKFLKEYVLAFICAKS